MSLDHEFLLVSTKEYLTKGYSGYHHNPAAIKLHDDVIGYIYDFISWINAYNTSCGGKPVTFEGEFNRCGVSLYKIDSAEKMRAVFSGLAKLFAEGPQVLNLKGDWVSEDNEATEKPIEYYERLVFERDLLIAKFQQIVNMANEVLCNNGELMILHLGI